MSLKKDVNAIGQELKNDQMLLENAFKLEVLFKKYKAALIGTLSVIIILVVGFFAYNSYKESQATKANALLMQLVQNPSDKEALNNLKNTHVNLYELYMLATSSEDVATLEELSKSKDELIATFAAYTLASVSQDAARLDNIQNPALKDLATLQAAYILLKDKKYDELKAKLNSIPNDSILADFKSILLHYKD